jgi:protein AbiQ
MILMMNRIRKMRIYRVSQAYLNYLHVVDHRVPHNPVEEYDDRRPFVEVLDIGSAKFYAPLEHPRKKHIQLHNSLHIVRIYDGTFGILALNNMIPVPQEALVDFDISVHTLKRILQTQYVFCQKNRMTIRNAALTVYSNRCIRPNAFEEQNFCDFLKLQYAKEQYQTHL